MESMPQTMQNLFDFPVFVSALAGGSLALLGVYITHHLENCRKEKEKKFKLNSYLTSIHDEIETIWENYQEKIGPRIISVQPNSPLLVYWPIADDYFSIYSNNTSNIFLINDHGLRKKIIVVYNKAKGMRDSLKMNNHLLSKYEFACSNNLANPTPTNQQMVDANLKVLVEYADLLRKSHTELVTIVEELLRTLRTTKGVLSQE
jgi:hypothetical protein